MTDTSAPPGSAMSVTSSGRSKPTGIASPRPGSPVMLVCSGGATRSWLDLAHFHDGKPRQRDEVVHVGDAVPAGARADGALIILIGRALEQLVERHEPASRVARHVLPVDLLQAQNVGGEALEHRAQHGRARREDRRATWAPRSRLSRLKVASRMARCLITPGRACHLTGIKAGACGPPMMRAATASRSVKSCRAPNVGGEACSEQSKAVGDESMYASTF